MQKTLSTAGFSLLELLITVAIIGIMVGISYPAYQNHLVRARRAEAKVTLTSLASHLEQYYAEKNTYAGATLENLGLKKTLIANSFYELSISNADDKSYLISAVPQKSQAKDDQECATLSLNEKDEEMINGRGSIDDCWNQ